ncbi:CcdB family protein [Nevskia ramosa]|uniref:CcdB family protein n=1 Tax=Nevskia ramosa TaxID=64002 RepID=UPI0003B60FD9|nr:CcdB family protein [Nevskia ramosa]
MAQFDVHAVPAADADYAPYLVELQSDLVSGLDTALVAPLVRRADAGPIVHHLNPVIRFGDDELVLRIGELVSLPRTVLGRKVGSIKSDREALMAAIDVIFFGI